MEKLVICGLGVRVPEETTLETLQALADCRVVYSDLEDEAGRTWLSGYCKLKKPASASAVVEDARKSGGVGLAVWGHPQSSSRLAREAELAAQKSGLAYRVLGSISPIGSVFARAVRFLGGDYGYQGIQAYDVETLAAEPEAAALALPLVLYSERAQASGWKPVLRDLARRYPAGHEGILFAADGERRGPLAELAPGPRSVVLVEPAPVP